MQQPFGHRCARLQSTLQFVCCREIKQTRKPALSSPATPRVRPTKAHPTTPSPSPQPPTYITRQPGRPAAQYNTSFPACSNRSHTTLTPSRTPEKTLYIRSRPRHPSQAKPDSLTMSSGKSWDRGLLVAVYNDAGQGLIEEAKTIDLPCTAQGIRPGLPDSYPGSPGHHFRWHSGKQNRRNCTWPYRHLFRCILTRSRTDNRTGKVHRLWQHCNTICMIHGPLFRKLPADIRPNRKCHHRWLDSRLDVPPPCTRQHRHR